MKREERTGADLDRLPARMLNLEEAAFKEFALVFGVRLRGLFRHLGMQLADAEALATSCLTDIALKVDRFVSRGPGSFERWVMKLGRVACIDEWRTNKDKPRHADPTEHPCETPIPDELAPGIARAVEEAVATLPEDDRTIVRLRDLEEGLSFGEIGRRLGMREGTARVRYHRVLKRLADILSEEQVIRKWHQRLRSSTEVTEEE